MLHKLISFLHHQMAFNHWLFLLTAYEWAKSDWIERIKVIEAAKLPAHGSNVSELCSRLQTTGMVLVKTLPNGTNSGTVYVKLTPTARQILREAFQSVKKEG